MLLATTILYFFLFLILFVFSFFPFGLYVTRKTKSDLSAWENITFAFCISIVGFVFTAILLGVLGLRFLMLPTLVIVNAFSIYKLKSEIFTNWKVFFANKFLVFLLFVGILVQGFINFPSGYLYKDGYLYWSSQGNDGLWHVAVMEEVKKTLPIESPIYSGEKLYNYHYLVDIFMGEFGRVYPIFSSQDLYFRFFPVMFSFFIGLSVFTFLNNYSQKKAVGYLGIFFTYLTGSFGYILTYLKNGQIFGGETIFWASQGNTILGNPPHAISYFVLISTFLAFALFSKNKSKKLFLLTVFLGSVLVGFKVSAGIVLIAGLLASGFFEIIIKRQFSIFLIALILLLTNFGFLMLISKGVGSFLIFEPWWFIRTTVVSPERLDWIDMELRRQHYLSKGTWHAYLRVIQLEGTAFLIFLFGNLGTRVIGFLELGRKFFKERLKILSDPVEVVLIVSMTTGFMIPLLFLQKGIAYNSIQFIQYFILIFGFYSAFAFYNLYNKFKSAILKLILVVILIVFSVPTVIGNLVEFYSRPALAKVDNYEIEAINYLRENTPEDAIILTTTFDKNAKFGAGAQPWPISVWYSTAYVSALTGRRTYLSNEDQVDILGYPVKIRRDQVDMFFGQEDFTWNNEFLSRSNITFLYVRKDELKKELDVTSNNLISVFENEEVSIYKYEN